MIALRTADYAIIVCDGKDGVTSLDQIIVDWLRKNSKVKLYLAVNKCESETVGLSQAQEFWSLGIKIYKINFDVTKLIFIFSIQQE